MKILSFDTVANASSVAICAGGKVIYSDCREMRRGHAEVLVPMIDIAVSKVEYEFKDFDAIGVTKGPGSFTGIRVGLSTAKSLSVLLDVPVIGVSTFEAILRAVGGRVTKKVPILISLDSKRTDLYLQLIGIEGKPLGDAGVISKDFVIDYILPYLGENRELMIVGDGAVSAREALLNSNEGLKIELGSHLSGPDAVHVGLLAHEKRISGEEPSVDPIYLSAPSVRLPPDSS